MAPTRNQIMNSEPNGSGRGYTELIRGHRAARVVPKVSKFYSAGAESLKSHIQIYQKHTYIGTNRFFMFQKVLVNSKFKISKTTMRDLRFDKIRLKVRPWRQRTSNCSICLLDSFFKYFVAMATKRKSYSVLENFAVIEQVASSWHATRWTIVCEIC